jgi:hypothetical protein
MGFERGDSEEIAGNSPEMAEREADLAIVVRRQWQIRAGRHRHARKSRRMSRSKRRRMMMPGEHYRLKNKRENCEGCARSAPAVPSLRAEGRSHCVFISQTGTGPVFGIV